MLLDMDMEDDDNPFGEDIEDDDFGSDEDDFLTRDEYEFADIDPEVFRDPTLLVKLSVFTNPSFTSSKTRNSPLTQTSRKPLIRSSVIICIAATPSALSHPNFAAA